LKKNCLVPAIVFLCAFFVAISPLTAFSFPNEPDGFGDIKWGSTPTEEMEKSKSVSFSENGKSLKVFYWEPQNIDTIENKIFSRKRIENTFWFIDNLFVGFQVVFSGREVLDTVTNHYIEKFGPPVSSCPDEDIVDTPDFRSWQSEKILALVFFEEETSTTHVVIFSRELMEKTEDGWLIESLELEDVKDTANADNADNVNSSACRGA